MARSRRLGIAGEVSAGPDREVHKKSAGVTQTFSRSRFFARIRTGVFLIGKTIIGRFSNKKLLEQRPMILFRIRSCARPGFVRARRGRGFFSTQRLQICADWVLSTQSSPAAPARVFATQRSRIRGDWILSTQRLPIHWSLRDSLGDDIAFFHPRCKQNFVVVFVSFFLELESIGTRKFKIVKIRGIYPRCKQNFVVVFVSFFLELESIETRNFKIVKIRGIYPRCNEISSSFSCRFFLI